MILIFFSNWHTINEHTSYFNKFIIRAHSSCALCSMVVIKSFETKLFNPSVDACLSYTYQDSIFRLRGGAPRLRRPRRRPDWQIPSSNEECDESYAGDFANHRSSCDSEWVPDDSSLSSGEKSAGKLIPINFVRRNTATGIHSM